MIVYKGSDVIFDHEPPKWNFWTSSSVEKNHSFARTCAFVQEEGNATGMLKIDENIPSFIELINATYLFRRSSACVRTVDDLGCRE